ncbi:hypothetical protein RRG08_059045 [Elysia crispata]|uniref:Uncharacterized protein n=1 Tax=Elysia crispata TaxID=231223 RepID=A0AAE1DF06_9GAST|nr:hypothetical protein RRG08_059045 [Elysia crispata]
MTNPDDIRRYQLKIGLMGRTFPVTFISRASESVVNVWRCEEWSTNTTSDAQEFFKKENLLVHSPFHELSIAVRLGSSVDTCVPYPQALSTPLSYSTGQRRMTHPGHQSYQTVYKPQAILTGRSKASHLKKYKLHKFPLTSIVWTSCDIY